MIFDMFVYGKAGRKFPYGIKVLTQLQLSELLISQKKYKGSSGILLRNLGFFLFFDATHE
jgi:hypothetical protein